MSFCHGGGRASDGDHCCYVEGAACPHYVNEAGLLAYIDSLGLKGARRTRALELAQGVKHACGIALRILTNDPSLVNDRPAFEAAWNSDPDYLAYPRPLWAALEEANGWPAGSYQCSSWGPPTAERGVRQCCFADSTATNEARATSAGLSTTAVTVRRAGGG